MNQNSTTISVRTFEGIDMLIGIFCIVLSFVCVITIGISLSAVWDPKTLLVLGPLGGIAMKFLLGLSKNLKKTNRGAWKLVLLDILNKFQYYKKEHTDGMKECQNGWKGLLERILMSILLFIVLLVFPVIIPILIIILTGTMFSLFIRILMFILGARV